MDCVLLAASSSIVAAMRSELDGYMDRVEAAGRQPPEAAVAEAGVGLLLRELVFQQCLTGPVEHAHDQLPQVLGVQSPTAVEHDEPGVQVRRRLVRHHPYRAGGNMLSVLRLLTAFRSERYHGQTLNKLVLINTCMGCLLYTSDAADE